MKIHQFISFLLIFTMVILLYPSIPAALYKQQSNNVYISKTRTLPVISPPNKIDKNTAEKENKIAIYYLNQKYFGISDYENAQRELQKFNRPLIGIVGQYSDWVSYREYQKKILGSSY